MTKEDRMETFMHGLKLPDPLVAPLTGRELLLMRAAFSKGYDQGFTDGVIQGSTHQAELHNRISEIFAGRA